MTGPLVFDITVRQREVLDVLMDKGESEQEIARRLGINHETVGSHLRKIYASARAAGAKVNSRDELIVALFRGRLRFRVVNRRDQS